jgi:hypothetical protein
VALRKRQILLFLAPDDEARLAADVKSAVPEVRLVDEWRWEDVTHPPVRQSPEECLGEIGLWNSKVEPELVGIARSNGKIDGPISGSVIQWVRCRLDDGRLSAGRWAATYDSNDKEIGAYVHKMWKMVMSATRDDLKRISGNPSQGPASERRFRVGEAAYSAAANGEITLVADQLVLAPE